jgi:hypothetical protein
VCSCSCKIRCTGRAFNSDCYISKWGLWSNAHTFHAGLDASKHMHSETQMFRHRSLLWCLGISPPAGALLLPEVVFESHCFAQMSFESSGLVLVMSGKAAVRLGIASPANSNNLFLFSRHPLMQFYLILTIKHRPTDPQQSA